MTTDHPSSPGLPPEDSSSSAIPPQQPIEISVRETKELIDSGASMILLDCREQNEYDQCRIEGSVLVPMHEIPDRIAELEDYRRQRIVVHCHLGGRSLRVTHWLREQGFETAQNMTGGIEAWSTEVDPQVPRY
jgi:rhodanese-related sulfurtransferase